MALRIENRKKTDCSAVPTPASDAAPRRATRMVSTMPRSVCSRLSPTTGRASASTRRQSLPLL